MQTHRESCTALDYLIPFAAWTLGIFIYFHKTLLSGFEWIQGDPGDPRLLNFILEHSYRWLLQLPPHCSYFDPPVFYPQTNVGCYTDLLLGVAPFYWVWRFVGIQPETAYQFWMIVLATLNFGAAYLLLKRFFSCGRVGSSLGALIFAFGTAQYSKLVHHQLVPQFYMLIALMAVLTMFHNGDSVKSRRNRCAAIIVFFLALAAQFYTSYYTFFFMGLVCASALGWALMVGSWRRQVLRLFCAHYVCIGTAAVLALLLVLPALIHYFSAIEDVGVRSLHPNTLARTYHWILTGKNNLLYGWVLKGPLHFIRGAHFWGIGYLTIILAAVGLLRQYKRVSLQVIVVAAVTTAILTTHITTQLGLWPYVREIIPGAKALRVMGRVAMVQLIPAAIGLGFFFQSLSRRRRWLLILILGSFCVLEQVNIDNKYISKPAVRAEIASIAMKVDPSCDAFLLFSDRKLRNIAELASWTTLATGRPTINGRYGNFPPNYPIPMRRNQKYPGTFTRQQVENALEEWCKSRSIPRQQIQVIDLGR